MREQVREFENERPWQAVIRKFIYSVQEGKGCTFSEMVYAHLPPHWGLLLKERIRSHREQILSFKSTPKYEVTQHDLSKE